MRETRQIVGVMASIPQRAGTLKETVSSILRQVDVLYLGLNGYNEPPEWIKHNKIRAELFPDGGYGAAYKLQYLSTHGDAYYFTFDDDLIYPPEYTSLLISRIDRHPEEIHVCWGIDISGCNNYDGPPVTDDNWQTFDFYLMRTLRVYGWDIRPRINTWLNIPGTGCMAMIPECVGLVEQICQYPIGVDWQLGKWCKDRGVLIRHEPQPVAWLISTNASTTAPMHRTEALKQIRAKIAYEGRPWPCYSQVQCV